MGSEVGVVVGFIVNNSRYRDDFFCFEGVVSVIWDEFIVDYWELLI